MPEGKVWFLWAGRLLGPLFSVLHLLGLFIHLAGGLKTSPPFGCT
jgi:hypothetical protein